MKAWTIISLFAVAAIMVACNSKHQTVTVNGEKKTTRDTIFNENIQTTFFGASFGDTKEEVVNAFAAHGLVEDKYSSSESLAHFFPKKGKYLSFGNLNWEMVDVGFSNDTFYYIRFMSPCENKVTAIQNYETVLTAVSAKYSMMEEEPEDTTVYKISAAYSKTHPRRTMYVSAFKYESISGNIFNGTILEYGDGDYEDNVSAEL